MSEERQYELYCKDRFDKLEEQVTNHIPHQINNLFWKMVALMGTWAAILITLIKAGK